MKVELEKLEKLGYGKREAFNSVRTNLSFCGADIQVITFTSCTPDEGKSSVVMELGRAMAEDGRKVLILDADLRKSVLWKYQSVPTFHEHSLNRHRSLPDAPQKNAAAYEA